MLLSWSLFLLYVVGTLALAIVGSRRTKNLESYALGSRTMSPWIVGMALAAAMTSTATLVINPGIVYVYGISAIFGYGVAAGTGLAFGIVILSKGFRRLGAASGALTVPQWIGQRFSSPRMTVFYALLNLLLIAMVVLICYAMAGLMVAVLDLTSLFPRFAFEIALVIVIVFVFAYTFVGGTFAHAYTNTVQGLIMLVVSLILIGSGLHLFGGEGLLSRLSAIDANLAAPTNPASVLFRNLFEVFGANLIVGFALSVQPHFLIKALYVKDDRAVNHYLTVAIACGVVFNAVMLCGLFARIEASEHVSQFMAASGLGIDGVMPGYITHTFSPTVQVLVSIALLAAGMSTLDGILVALSTIFASDIYLVLWGDRGDSEAAARQGLRIGRYALVALGVIAFVVSLLQHHYKQLSVVIFAQEGIYALFAATFVPVLFGMFSRRIGARTAVAASVVALLVHFGFRYGHLTILTDADHTNPGLTASYALIASLIVVGLSQVPLRRR